MDTLNININYTVDSDFNYNILIQYNRNNKSENVFFGTEQLRGYTQLIKFSTTIVLNWIDKKESDFNTINHNVVNFKNI